jgi:hypothetical protein
MHAIPLLLKPYNASSRPPMTTLLSHIATLRDSLHALKDKTMHVHQFCTLWRAQAALFQALPAQYQRVADDVLVRLESGSLFTEESCSFSQEDLLANLSVWCDKAEQTLSKSAT